MKKKKKLILAFELLNQSMKRISEGLYHITDSHFTEVEN